MSIKYHDNTTPPTAGPDGTLSDNWDRSADHGGEYVRVHFRIRTSAYERGNDWHGHGSDPFDAESREIFIRLGWSVAEQRACGCSATVRKGKTWLYLHPQDFSGEVLKREVVGIAEALSCAKEFSLRWVDLYETAYDMTDEAYIAYLVGQEDRIRSEVLKTSVTTRRSNFYRDYDVACHVAGVVRLRRIGEDDGRSGGAGKTANHILGVIDKLIDEGYLKTATSRRGYRLIRTLNKTEQKKEKRYISQEGERYGT